MAYIECKIWNFQEDDDYSQKTRHNAIKKGHEYYSVKILINTSFSVNYISKSLANKLGEKYGNHYKNKRVKNSLGTIGYLDLSF